MIYVILLHFYCSSLSYTRTFEHTCWVQVFLFCCMWTSSLIIRVWFVAVSDDEEKPVHTGPSTLSQLTLYSTYTPLWLWLKCVCYSGVSSLLWHILNDTLASGLKLFWSLHIILCAVFQVYQVSSVTSLCCLSVLRPAFVIECHFDLLPRDQRVFSFALFQLSLSVNASLVSLSLDQQPVLKFGFLQILCKEI